MELCNTSNIVYVNSRKEIASFVRDFISVARKFTIEKVSFFIEWPS